MGSWIFTFSSDIINIMESGLKKTIVGFLFTVTVVISVSALSAPELEAFLEWDDFNWDGACYLLLTQAGEIDPDAVWEESFLLWREREGWPALVKSDWKGEPSFGAFSLMVFEVLPWAPETLFLTLFPSPRTAAREIISRGWLPGQAHAGRALSAEEVIFLINQVELYRRSEE